MEHHPGQWGALTGTSTVEGEPIEWTGWACCQKREAEANPGFPCVTAAPSTRKGAEVIGPYAAQKSL
jgi:hypothetical protein